MTVTTASASVATLLAKAGFETVDAIFDDKDSGGRARGAVVMKLWMAFDEFEAAERHYRQALAAVDTDARDQRAALHDGNTIDAKWLTQHAEQASAAAAQMASATQTILSMSTILSKF